MTCFIAGVREARVGGPHMVITGFPQDELYLECGEETEGRSLISLIPSKGPLASRL